MSRAWRAKQIEKGVIDGDFVMQYKQLCRYAAEIKQRNPANTCVINVQRPSLNISPTFRSFYMCLEGCKSTFKKACCPLIGVDGCHLKTKYGGQLLIAVGRDLNDQYLPLAFAVVETETKESWRWFLNLLLEDIGDV
uniref:MULE transposase domain-containing protein n=1 Tax=Cajanus cajan TaxID=3821 RepID=A0A151RAX8_CAJCA|nr:hypothetical protein KK1_039035 [Cajanus cajan]